MLPLALALVVQAQQAAQPTPEPRLLRQPAISGGTIVFVHAGDLWVTSTGGGATRRLTSHPGLEQRPKISPDGKWVAFTGQYDGNNDVYVIPVTGGEPKRLTYEPQADNVLGWTPDGRVAYASLFGSASARTPRLWTVPATGGMPKRTAIDEISEGSFLDGDTVVYNRFGSSSFNWRRYRGGTQGRISLYNLKTNAYRELPAGREQFYWPMAVGRSVIYASDKKLATLNLYRYDLDSGKETQLTEFTDADVRFPTTDGKRVAFEKDGLLYTLDLATKAVSSVRPTISAENLQARPGLKRLFTQITDLSLSPTGTRVLVEARGDIFTLPAREGDTRNLTDTQGPRERFPAWSPDGKTIAFTRQFDYDPRLYVRPAAGGDDVLVTASLPKNVTSLDWSPNNKWIIVRTRSGGVTLVDVAAKTTLDVVRPILPGTTAEFSPDSKWIALTLGRQNGQSALYLYEVATAKLTQVTEGYYNDFNVTFDQNGKYLYFLSDRTFQQIGNSEGGFDLTVRNATRAYVLPLAADTGNPLTEPSEEEPTGDSPGKKDDESNATKVDFEGLASRAIPLPFEAGNYGGIVGVEDGVLVLGEDGIQKFDLDSRSIQPITGPFGGSVAFNAARTKMAMYTGISLRVTDVRPGLPPNFGLVDLGDVTAVVDPRAEWKEIFWESWRWIRDNYYDPNIRGLNWTAIGNQYAKYLPYVDHRTDLNEVLSRMIAELGTGHSYVGGGDYGVSVPLIMTGLLGADYTVEGGKVRFEKIYRGDAADETRRGPLAEAGNAVKEGDYLMAIDGKPVDEEHTPSSLLVNKVGKYVTLTISKSGTKGDQKTIRVMPMADEGALRYGEWVEGNRRRVTELSGGRIGYLHVPNTGNEGANEFTRGYRAATDKEALIVDERNNGGGNLPNFFVEALARQNTTRIQQRNGVDVPGNSAVPGPKVMLINQNAGSGGDMFPWLFRKAGLGPLIGTRTWGGLVGISGPAPLVDGGAVFAPEFSIFDPDTNRIIAENTGVDPDIEIDNRPDQVAQGRDPQLERAVEELLAKLRSMPAKPPRRDLPQVGDKGRIPPR
ncbi:hypothetical protein EON82_07295 [bacterium]|nr:MAG: hypothetical protein EON82_07295 [bacterium]